MMALNGNRNVFKDKEKPTEVRLSNITAAKGMCTQLNWSSVYIDR